MNAPAAENTGSPSSQTTQAIPWQALIACLTALIALYLPTVLRLSYSWDNDPNYSHGYFVPFISVAIAYCVFRRFGVPNEGKPLIGSFTFACGLLCHLFAMIRREPPLDFLGLFLILRGMLVSLGGDRWASRFSFSILFLFFMFPVPVTWTNTLAIWLQDLVSRVSEEVLGWFFVVYRQGHTLHIAGMQEGLVVAAECSGLRQLVAFLAFATLYGYLMDRSLIRRGMLIFAAIPVAVAANVLRVLLMNLGAYWFGTNWLSGTLHHTPVLFSLPVGLLLFLLCDQMFGGNSINSWGEPEKSASGENAPAATVANVPANLSKKLLAFGIVLISSAGVEYGLARHIANAGSLSYPAAIGAFESIPLTFPGEGATKRDEWQGVNRDERRELIRSKLPFTPADIMSRAYGSNLLGTVVEVYAVHSLSGEDRKHHPEICIREVSGAPEDLEFRKVVKLRGDDHRTVQRFRFLTGVGRSIVVYYWTYRFEPNPIAGSTFLQRMHQQVGIDAPSVTVQVTTSESEPNKLAEIEEVFLPALDDSLTRLVLPPRAQIGHDRLPISLSR